MTQGGHFNAIALERVVFGRPAAEAVPGELERLGRSRACLLVSHSLRTGTSAVSNLEEALGDAAVGTYSGMPPHTPREAVIECAALARESRADIIVTLGGTSLGLEAQNGCNHGEDLQIRVSGCCKHVFRAGVRGVRRPWPVVALARR